MRLQPGSLGVAWHGHVRAPPPLYNASPSTAHPQPAHLLLQMLQYPHLPPLMTQLGQSGVNAAQPYYYLGGGGSVHDPSMRSVQATCSMRLASASTALPPASLAAAAATAATPPPPAATATAAAVIDPFTRPRAALAAEPPTLAPVQLQPPAFASHAAYCGQHGGQPHWFLPPDGATSWTPPGAPGTPGASWAPPGAPGVVQAPSAPMLPAACGLPHPSGYPAPDCHFLAPRPAQPAAQPAAPGTAALGTAPPAHAAAGASVRPPAPPQPLPGTAADSGNFGGGLPGGGLPGDLLGYGGGLTSTSASSHDGAGRWPPSSAVPLHAAAPAANPAASQMRGGKSPTTTRLLELQRDLLQQDLVKREMAAAARSPDLELNLSSLAGLAGLSGDRDLQIAGLSGLSGLSGFGNVPQGAASDLLPLAVSDDQSGPGQLLPELFL